MKRVLVVQFCFNRVATAVYFHTFEKNIFVIVKNWWSLTHGQVYILSIDDGKRTVFLSMESSFSNLVSRNAFPPIVMLPFKSIFARVVNFAY